MSTRFEHCCSLASRVERERSGQTGALSCLCTEEVLGEWQQLDDSVKSQFKKRLSEQLIEPRIPSSRLSGHPGRYKIKLRHLGYRLVYEVPDERVVVPVVTLSSSPRST